MKLYRKAVELSVNFIVTIIIAIVVFAAGLYLLGKTRSQVSGLIDDNDAAVQKMIEDIECSGGQYACIGTREKSIVAGKAEYFTVKLFNNRDSETLFNITITPLSAFAAGTKESISASVIAEKVAVSAEKNYTIGSKQEKSTVMGAMIKRGSPSGTYQFQISVEYEESGIIRSYVNPMVVYVQLK
jgi:hypothetical protein